MQAPIICSVTAPAIWLVRPQAEPIGRRLERSLGGTIFRPWQDAKTTPKDLFRASFSQHSQWVIVGTTGIAVRFIDGLVIDKSTDPAVVVLDEGCHHAVSLLSGHEGGANQLAFVVANAVGAIPIVTTASEALKPLIVGVGCRKGVSAKKIEECIKLALANRTLDEVRVIATIDLKADEPGLRQFVNDHGIPLLVFGKDEVASRPWVTAGSAWVKEVVGVEGVCEPCALMVSPRARLLVAKTTLNGVAIAVAEDSLRFAL